MKSIEEQQVVQIARALGNPTRFSIYKHITEVDEMRCQDICVDTPVQAPTVSHHLKILSDAGLVESRRVGQGVYYRTVPEKLNVYLRYLKEFDRRAHHLKRTIASTQVVANE